MEWSRNGKSKRTEVQLQMFFETEFLYSPGYFRTCCVDQAGPKLRFTCFCLPDLGIKGMCHYIPPREFSFTSSAGLFGTLYKCQHVFLVGTTQLSSVLSLYFSRHIFYVALAGFKLRAIYSAHPQPPCLKLKDLTSLSPHYISLL